MDWTTWRDEFPIFKEKTYLNTCSLAPLSRRVRAAQERFLDEWEAMGSSAWYSHWLDALDNLRTKVAHVIGARKEEIALAPSISVALSSIASSLDYRERPRVVLSEVDFPTVGHQWAVKSGVERVVLPSDDRIWTPAARFEAAIDDQTAAAATSQVVYLSGAIQAISEIARAARRHGAVSIIDAYQATSQLPTDVHALGVDVLITGGLKWLLGGTGIAFLYVRQDLIPVLRPSITGWFAAERQFEFDVRSFEFRTDARRFELGTPANAAVYAASAGIDIVGEIGVEALRARTGDLVTDLADRAVDAGFEIKTPAKPDDRAGIVMIRTEKPADAVKSLGDKRILVDYRRDRVRASPYFYNTPEDNAKLIESLQALRR